MEDHIIRGDGPTATSSKIGYLLSGPVSHTHSLNIVTSALHISTQHNEDDSIQKFYDLETTGIAVESNSDKQFYKSTRGHVLLVFMMVHTAPDSRGKRATHHCQLTLMYVGREPVHWLTVFH